jgi:hypothetical protein
MKVLAARKHAPKGAVLALFALCLPVLFASLGLGVDMGHMFSQKRRLQIGVDSAALAAAHALRRGNDGQIVAAAGAACEANGFDLSSGDLTVNRPPLAGPKAGDSNFIEVILTEESDTFFLRAVGIDEQVVTARATAGLLFSGGACMLVLETDDEKSLHINGKAKVDLKNCSVYINSDDSNALMGEGDAEFTASDISVVGDYYGDIFDPEPNSDVDPVDDPLADLAEPPYGSCDHDGEYQIDNNRTLSPGVFCGGLKLTSSANVTFLPGIYIIAGGGMQIVDDASISGENVMFYLTESKDYDYKKLEFSTNGDIDLSGRTSGDHKGILFFQDRDIDDGEMSEFKNDTTGDFSGTFYFPTTTLLFTDKFKVVDADMLIVTSKIEINDDVIFELNSSDPLAIVPTSLGQARLVE